MVGPPTPAEKVTVLAKEVFGRLGLPSSNIPRVQPQGDAPAEPTSSPPRRAKRQAECQDPIDLAILMDSSGSISRTDFFQAVSDVATLIHYTCNDFLCNNGPRIRLAMLTFSSHAITVCNFDRSAQFTTLREMVMAINETGTRYIGDMTATAAAIKYVSDNIFNTRYGMRPSSTRRLLVVTDGKNNGGGNPRREAENLHDAKNVDVYALSIGNEILEDNVREITTISKEAEKYVLPFLAFSSTADFSQGVLAVVKAVAIAMNPAKCLDSAVKK